MSEPKSATSASLPDSLVHPEALNEVFDVVDVNGDGVLTVHQFIVALRKNPEIGRLLDLGTVVRQENDSRDLFEKVFQKLDKDSSRTVNRSEFQEYFKPEQVTDGARCDVSTSSAVHSDPTATQTPQLSQEVDDDEWQEVPSGCCGGGVKKSKPKHAPRIVVSAQHQPVVPPAVVRELPASAPAPLAAVPQPQPQPQQHTASTSTGAAISPNELEKLQQELAFLRSQLKNRGDALRGKEVRLEDMEKEHTKLRQAYNYQSLKKDMLIHMWSMHLLDSDADADE